MSIVALKRKSERFIHRISHNQDSNGFALNGTLRNSGWIGQTSLDRIGSATPFCVAQTPIVKKSTMNTLGHLSSRVRYPVSAGCTGNKCNFLNNTFMKNNKKVSIKNDHTASGHIDDIVNNNICKLTTNGCTGNPTIKNNPAEFKGKLVCPPNGGCTSSSYYIGGRLVYNKPYNKDVSSFSAMSAGDYIQRRKTPLNPKYNALESNK